MDPTAAPSSSGGAFCLERFDAILLDMDGTLYHADRALPGAASLLGWLEESGRPFCCLTNNSANTASELCDRLSRVGANVTSSHIYTAADAMARILKQRDEPARVFNFAGRSLPIEAQREGVSVQWVESLDEPCDVVTVGTYAREYRQDVDWDRAVLALGHLRAGASLLAGSADRAFPIEGGHLEFGTGAWATMLIYAANLSEDRITFAGKPEPVFLQTLCQKLDVEPSRCLLVGDNLESDILGATRLNMPSALVLTGVSRQQDVEHAAAKPTWVFDDVQAMLDAGR